MAPRAIVRGGLLCAVAVAATAAARIGTHAGSPARVAQGAAADGPAAWAGFGHGVLRRDCAPSDAPALDVRLMQQPIACDAIAGNPGPWLRILVWPYSQGDRRSLFRFDAARRGDTDGLAARCSGRGACEPAESGVIEFETFDDHEAAGRCELVFRNGDRLQQRFQATWCGGSLRCGME